MAEGDMFKILAEQDDGLANAIRHIAEHFERSATRLELKEYEVAENEFLTGCEDVDTLSGAMQQRLASDPRGIRIIMEMLGMTN